MPLFLKLLLIAVVGVVATIFLNKKLKDFKEAVNIVGTILTLLALFSVYAIDKVSNNNPSEPVVEQIEQARVDSVVTALSNLVHRDLIILESGYLYIVSRVTDEGVITIYPEYPGIVDSRDHYIKDVAGWGVAKIISYKENPLAWAEVRWSRTP